MSKIMSELTSNMKTGLSADDCAKRVWCEALIDAHIFVFIQIGDV